MKNPYGILGVARDADARQLREAYRALAARHEGNARRMRKLNEAYDAILLSRGGGGEALARLTRVPEGERDSPWHYRMGRAQRERGWLEEAEAHFARAALFDPENRKYRAALQRARRDRAGKGTKRVSADDVAEAFQQGCAECCAECICP